LYSKAFLALRAKSVDLKILSDINEIVKRRESKRKEIVVSRQVDNWVKLYPTSDIDAEDAKKIFESRYDKIRKCEIEWEGAQKKVDKIHKYSQQEGKAWQRLLSLNEEIEELGQDSNNQEQKIEILKKIDKERDLIKKFEEEINNELELDDEMVRGET